MKKFLGAILVLSLATAALPMASFAETAKEKKTVKETTQTAPVKTLSTQEFVDKAVGMIKDVKIDDNTGVTRGMIVTILYNLSGEEYGHDLLRFADVDGTKYYAKAVTWAAEAGIVSGHSKTKFAPDDYVTREQFAVILYNYAKYKGMDVSDIEGMAIKEFGDYDKISSWADTAIRYCIAKGIITGSDDGNFDPQGNENISDATGMLVKFLGE